MKTPIKWTATAGAGMSITVFNKETGTIDVITNVKTIERQSDGNGLTRIDLKDGSFLEIL